MITLEKTRKARRPFSSFFVFTRCLGENWTSGPRKMISGEATHCLVSALDGKRIQFGIGILTKRICCYLLFLLNRYFLTNDYCNIRPSLIRSVRLCRSEMLRLYRFHRLQLQLRTHVINFRLRLQLFENGVIDYTLQITIIIETFSALVLSWSHDTDVIKQKARERA